MKILTIFIITLLHSLNASNTLQHFKVAFDPPTFEKRKITNVENYQKKASSFVYDVPFNIIGNVSENDLILFRNEYLALPSVLKNSISSITITNQNLGIICGFASPYKVKGCAISDTNEIYLDGVYRQGDLIHESIHAYSYQNDRIDSDAFQMAYAQEGNLIAIQSGNNHNIYEYFVSAYLLYMYDPSSLQIRAPLTYQYFVSC